MAIVVTGAAGELGHHVIDELLRRVSPDRITAVVRTTEELKTCRFEACTYTGRIATTFSIGRDHWATEQVFAASGLRHVVLRNGWYNENYTGHLDAILEHNPVARFPIHS